ncbi:nucleotidyl transferase AbiEii/AbiGii toxin family protein [Sphingorhabdus sp. IMCC26285]|uniref:Nucleotidyl transferase AbiEii/AbiGii toxin family protein n=1 Tax=Sphingorhabdus profundilacus TaxID=2509718 RepID=A0A6I4LZ23_9SPHN|nr:nucleotidyl transferase AbiEii/AbiGii toxin family protein [Sphingorhabdus profundilacus]
MMANMSFLNAPVKKLLGRVAGAIGVDESFVEKDFYVVAAIRILLGCATEDLNPVFSGGTALLKAHKLVERFSEDMDFKLHLSEAFTAKSGNQRRNILSAFKNDIVNAWVAAGFTIVDVKALDGNGFIAISMQYPSVLETGDMHPALRPHILAEISAKPPKLPTLSKSVQSFVLAERGGDAEVPDIQCIDPVETAADKLSAFAWRSIVRDRTHPNDDPAIIRHVHDLAKLAPVIEHSAIFPKLLAEVMTADNDRGQGQIADMPPTERLAKMNELLGSDDAYKAEYEKFVVGMAFAGSDETPSFEEAIQAVSRLSSLLSK